LRVLVFSDTHGKLDLALEVIKKERADYVLHAGDLIHDARALAAVVDVPVYGVAGNCDLPGSGPEEELLPLGGTRILLVHGHGFRVKVSYQGIFYRAREKEADALVFGHTHVPMNEMHQGILLFNPGSISRPQPGNRPSYGILVIEDNKIKGEIHFTGG